VFPPEKPKMFAGRRCIVQSTTTNYSLEETRLAVVNESCFSFLFCAKTKNRLTKNPFANVVKKHVWSYFQSHRKKTQTVFRQ
jgi:hypothetical protein